MSRNKKETIFFFYYVKEYIENMQIELKSQKTIETYRTGLNDFRKYFFTEHGKSVDRIMVSDISADMVNEYLYWLVKNGCSINTRNIRLAALLFFTTSGHADPKPVIKNSDFQDWRTSSIMI